MKNILEVVVDFFSNLYRNIRRGFKKYKKMLIKQTKEGDYSILGCTALGIVALILVIVLLVSLTANSGHKKEKETTTSGATTEDIATQPEASRTDITGLASEAKAIYEANKDFLVLVNSGNPITDGYTFTHHTLNSGYDVDEKIYSDLSKMLSDCNTAGHEYTIVGGYVSREAQQREYEDTVTAYINKGHTAEEAAELAAKVTNKAGYNEHETGLTIDVVALGNTKQSDATTDQTIKWLAANCKNYGFIYRYPVEKASVTGINGEPWHFRYVGKAAATFIMDNNLCLEEFYNLVNQ